MNILIDACQKLFGGDFMYKKKGEIVKLTIRIDTKQLDDFKKICQVRGLSANNQINIFIKKFNFENSYLFQDNTSIDFCDKKVTPKD